MESDSFSTTRRLVASQEHIPRETRNPQGRLPDPMLSKCHFCSLFCFLCVRGSSDVFLVATAKGAEGTILKGVEGSLGGLLTESSDGCLVVLLLPM